MIVLLGLFVLLSVLPWLLPRGSEARTLPEAPFADSRITMLNQVRWHVRAGGPEGRPLVVLIHGFAGSTASWDQTRPVLHGRGWRTLAIDLPAFGYSGREPLPVDETGALWQLIDAEQQGQAVALVGHSMGAGVVTRLALERPAATKGLILVDGGMGLRSNPPSLRGTALQTLLAYPPVPRWIDWYASHWLYTPEQFQQLLGSAYGRPPTPEEVERYLAPMQVAGTSAAILARMRRRGESLPAEPASELRMPITLIWGRKDTWVPLAIAEATQLRLPQAELKVIEDAGHNPMETHPEAFTLLLLQALENAIRPDFTPLQPDGTPTP
ncbi:MAG: alpha/beta hydrolase [Xanthomonadales bacterium]|nr:alpha/beta hydrolase [Xanthomonadales bacterium]